MKEKAIEYIKTKIMKNNFKITEFTFPKFNDLKVYVTPCSYDTVITDFSQVEYFLINCDIINFYGCDTVEKLAETLLNMEKTIKFDFEEKMKCKQFFESHILPHKNDPNWKSYESDDFSYYSDWHKDLFGFRPRSLEPADFGACINAHTKEVYSTFNEEKLKSLYELCN